MKSTRRITIKAFYTFVFGFFGFHNKGMLALQTFDKTPVYTEINHGDDVKLDCVILNKVGNCIWQKNRKPLAMHPSKYEWAGNEQKGDCSILIRKAVAEYDEGDWECQVTQSDVAVQDSLSSTPVRLIVRAQPREPRIEHNGTMVLSNQNVTVKSEEKAIVKCVSRYGNPPALLKWYLDDEEILARNQTNVHEPDNTRTYVAMSTLELYVNKSHYGKIIKCKAFHESYDTKSRSVQVKLDITYPPEVTLMGVPHHDIEEGKDTVTLRCIADANPPASIIWQRAGSRDIAGTSETLAFKPVHQRDSGTYSCTANNPIGSSQPISTTLDVKYAPIIKSVGPEKLTTVPLYSRTSFMCSADGNPAPKYQWLQRISNAHGSSENSTVRSFEPKMDLINVTYDYQGDYVCVVSNVIDGSERSVQSQPITLSVIGGPLIMTQASKNEVIAHRGENAVLKVIVCADPRPRRAAWEWGSMLLEAGAGIGRTQAEELLAYTQEDCYLARFHIKRVDHADSRNYHLTVENERGVDKHVVHLTVREPLGMSAVFTVALGSLVAFVVCVLLLVYVIKSRKCCFRRRRRGDFKPKNTESCNNDNEKSEINSSNGMKTPKIEAMMDSGLNNDNLLYCTSPNRRPPPPHTISTASPDAMKKKRRAIYESEICESDGWRPTPSQKSLSKSSRRSGCHISTLCGDYMMATAQSDESRYCHKFVKNNERGRSARAATVNKCNTFSELQIPTVSDNGATRNRMACYNRQIIVHPREDADDRLAWVAAEGEYFCPRPVAKAQTAADYEYRYECQDQLEYMQTFRQTFDNNVSVNSRVYDDRDGDIF